MILGAEFLVRETSLENYHNSRVMGKTVPFRKHYGCLFNYFHVNFGRKIIKFLVKTF